MILDMFLIMSELMKMLPGHLNMPMPISVSGKLAKELGKPKEEIDLYAKQGNEL